MCRCGCIDASGLGVHRIIAALADDDVDAAIAEGLLDAVACDACAAACRGQLLIARNERRAALAARDRFRAREARRARRHEDRMQRRQAVMPVAATAGPVLPPAAAAALARARAKAAGSASE